MTRKRKDNIDHNKFPFAYHRLEEMTDLIDLTKGTIKEIKNQKNTRIVIIETWLLIDFIIRDAIMTLLELKKHSREDCDLKYSLLPKSFMECVEFLKKFKKSQDKLKEIKPAVRHQITYGGSWELIMYIRENNPNIFKDIELLTDAFFKDKGETRPMVYLDMPEEEKIKYKSINKDLEIQLAKFTDEWFKSAEKLNKARNKSAHLINPGEIYIIFGINGDNKLKKLKTVCSQLIFELIGVK